MTSGSSRIRLNHLLQSKYDAVLVREYRQQSNTQIRNLISPRNEWGDHLVVGDIDDQPCVAAKKGQIVRRTFSRMQPENIFIVKPEIEAWYLAGLDAKSCRELGVAEIHNTDRYTKELFTLLVEASHFDSRVDLMQEMLRLFSVEVAGLRAVTLTHHLRSPRLCSPRNTRGIALSQSPAGRQAP
jgi:hypothetical protein